MMSEKRESTNIGKIIAITLAVVAGACAVIWFALKLYRKYCLLECDYAEEQEELFDDDVCDCEVVVEENEPEALEEVSEEPAEA
ncbi:MAG: hypothetical protein J6R04_06595 [Clostridia bacterium]|nr:hypothetical protein [Clostridia bacterium]